MRINLYAEELIDGYEIVGKKGGPEGKKYLGIRLFVTGKMTAQREGSKEEMRPAITFWIEKENQETEIMDANENARLLATAASLIELMTTNKKGTA